MEAAAPSQPAPQPADPSQTDADAAAAAGTAASAAAAPSHTPPPPPPPPRLRAAPVGKKPLARLLEGAVRYSRVLSALLVAVGVLGFAALPAAMRQTHFDENALLAGSARPTLRSHTPEAVSLGAALAAAAAAAHPSPRYAAALQASLTQLLGLEAYASAFTTPWPYGGREALHCTNVHAILRAPRGDGKETVVVVTPLQMQAAVRDFAQPAAAAAAALTAGGALMAHLARAPWLSKDVVWVLPDASCGLVESMEAWVAAYQPQAPSGEGGDRAFGRAGVLQQALVVQVEAWPFSAAELLVMGADGQLPKLDMFWLVRYYMGVWARGVPLLLQHEAALVPSVARALAALPPAAALPPPAAAHVGRVASVAAFVGAQALGRPAGPHAALKRHNADAVTLRLTAPAAAEGGGGAAGRGQWRLQDPHVALGALLDVMELVVRSCSVLIEKFHHSFFLYLQVGTEHFVTVEVYIILPAALIAALLLRAAATQQDAAERRGSAEAVGAAWVAGARLVAGCYALCLAAGWLLRAGATAACCGAGVAGAALRLYHAGGAAAAAAALLGAREVVAGVWAAAAARRARGRGGGAKAASGDRGSGAVPAHAAAPEWRQVKALLLSVAAVQLAAMACINWALAYATGLAVIPLSGCSSWLESEGPPPPPPEGAAAAAAVAAAQQLRWRRLRRRARRARAARQAAVAAFNPLAVLCVLWLAGGQALAELPGSWAWLLLETRSTTYLFWWGAYLPFWCLALLIGAAL